MSDFGVIQELSTMIVGSDDTQVVPRFLRGKVTAVDFATSTPMLQINLHGAAGDVARVRWGAGNAARVGEDVWVFRLGNTLMAWGSPVTPWITPTLTNSWVRFDANAPPPQYRGYVNGDVQLRGVMKSGTINASAFTLPVGFRPVIANGYNGPVASNTAFGYVNVNSSGLVVPVVGSNVWYSFDGVIFSTLPE